MGMHIPSQKYNGGKGQKGNSEKTRTHEVMRTCPGKENFTGDVRRY